MEEENVSAMKIYQWAKEGQYEFAFLYVKFHILRWKEKMVLLVMHIKT